MYASRRGHQKLRFSCVVNGANTNEIPPGALLFPLKAFSSRCTYSVLISWRGLLTALGKSEHGVYWEPSVKPNHPWSCLFPNLSEYQPHVGPAPRIFRGVTEKQACFLVVFSNPAKAFRLIIFHISRVYRLFMAWYPTLKALHPHFMPLNTFILACFSRDGAGEEGKIPAKFLN